MMKSKAKLAVLIAVLFTTACTASATRRSFGEGYRDSLTSSKIKWTMGRDKEVRAGDVNVETWRGKVTLTGVVETEAEKAAAERIARNTKNVSEVRNYIDVVGSYSQPVVVKNIEESAIPEVKVTSNSGVATETAEKTVSKDTVKPSGKKFKERIPDPITIAGKKTAKPEKAAKVKPVRQNAVSYEIGKELAATEDANYYEADGKNVKPVEEYEHDVTLQAEKELMELKARRGK